MVKITIVSLFILASSFSTHAMIPFGRSPIKPKKLNVVRDRSLRKQVLIDNFERNEVQRRELKRQEEELRLLKKEHDLKEKYLKIRDKDGNTALHCMIKSLMEKGEPKKNLIAKLDIGIKRYMSPLINTPNKTGVKPLEQLIDLFPKDNNTYWVVTLLIQHGAEVTEELCKKAKKESLPEVSRYLETHLKTLKHKK